MLFCKNGIVKNTVKYAFREYKKHKCACFYCFLFYKSDDYEVKISFFVYGLYGTRCFYCVHF